MILDVLLEPCYGAMTSTTKIVTKTIVKCYQCVKLLYFKHIVKEEGHRMICPMGVRNSRKDDRCDVPSLLDIVFTIKFAHVKHKMWD